MAGGEEARKEKKKILRLAINKTEMSLNNIKSRLHRTNKKKINKTRNKGIMIIKQKMVESMQLLSIK